MTSYGYKVLELSLTPHRSMERKSFTEPDPDGLHSAILAAAKGQVSIGQLDEKRTVYNRFDDVKHSNWGILINSSGGFYGEYGELVDVEQDADRRVISPTDAVLRESRVLLLVPPYGDTGLVVSEVRGRSHQTAGVIKSLNASLEGDGIRLRVLSDVADEHAWNQYLEDEAVGVTSVELVQKRQAADRTNFTNENVKSANLRIDLEDGTEPKRRISAALRALKNTTHTRPKLAGMIGLLNYSDEDFDEEFITTVVDGKKRKINVTSGWPSFTYALEADGRLNDQSFIDSVSDVAASTFKALNVDLAANWRPRIAE